MKIDFKQIGKKALGFAEVLFGPFPKPKAKKEEEAGYLISETLTSLADKLGKAGIPGTEETDPLEKLVEASHQKHFLRKIEQTEQAASSLLPILLEKIRQYELLKKNQIDDLEKFNKTEKKSKKRQLGFLAKSNRYKRKQRRKQIEIAQTEKASLVKAYKTACSTQKTPNTGQPIKNIPAGIFWAISFILFCVETGANFVSFSNVFRENLLSTGLLAIGVSIALTILAKLSGWFLSKASQHRHLATILSIGIGTAFSILIGGTRTFGMEATFVPGSYGEISNILVNLILFLTIFCLSFQYYRQKQLCNSINPILESLDSVESEIQTAKANLKSLEIDRIEKVRAIEESYELRLGEFKNQLERKGLEIAEEITKYQKLVNTIDHTAKVIEAEGAEILWGARIFNRLARNSQDIPQSHKTDPKLKIRPLSDFKQRIKPNPTTH